MVVERAEAGPDVAVDNPEPLSKGPLRAVEVACPAPLNLSVLELTSEE